MYFQYPISTSSNTAAFSLEMVPAFQVHVVMIICSGPGIGTSQCLSSCTQRFYAQSEIT